MGKSRRRPGVLLVVGTLTLVALSSIAAADDLSNRAFVIQYDGSGIRSLKRANDAYDTDYIAANGALGRLLIRYRTTRNGDWRELRELLLTAPQAGGRTIGYSLGVRPPTLAARSTAGAAVGAAGLRALNDGLFPSVSPPGGRGAGGGRGGGPGAPVDIPLFTWTGSRGPTQFVQYTFPAEELVSRVEVFWTIPPESWRLLYQDGRQWKEVSPSGPYGRDPNTFTVLEFATVRTMAMRVEVSLSPESTAGLAEWRVGPEPALEASTDLAVSETFTLEDDVLDWKITLSNTGSQSVEVGDLAVPFNFAERTGARGDIYTRKLLRHALVAGHGSWAFWQRSNGEGPYLVMTPIGASKFEYSDSSSGAYTPYVHAKAASAAALANGGNWRLPISNLTIPPNGAPVSYTFRFQWAKDFAGVRDVLFKEGKFDTTVVPGMVIPNDLPASIALRTRNTVSAIEAEYPTSTTIEAVERTREDVAIFRVRFSRLGENMLRIKYGNGQWSTLEFFVTEPLETVIQKRAAFLVSHHQHTDPGQWYVGVYSDWDQKNEILRSPEDRDNLSAWLTDANDDAGNARPAFVASKNVFFPKQTEIDSLELYISKYLWGGMQMTDTEKYPYGIYGIPNWKANRSSADEGRNGRAHLWRIYDYPHIVMLYYRMFQIGRFYPEKVKSLTADQYLERAYRTAIAYWTVPTRSRSGRPMRSAR